MADAFTLDDLRRAPDREDPNLVAVDATDRLVLDVAAPLLDEAGSGHVVVLGDRYGALALGAAGFHGCDGIRVFQDGVIGERALAANGRRLGLAGAVRSLPLGPELLDGARVVLVQLPRALAELDEWMDAVARYAEPEVTVVAGGRIKHMSVAMNDVLRRSFERLDVGLARQKSRTLTASGPHAPAETRFPVAAAVRAAELPGGALEIRAHGGAFAGATLDIGTRFLLGLLPQMPSASDVIDLGSGTGVIATAFALARQGARVLGVDQSAAAVASTAATARANGVGDRVRAVREDGLSEREEGSADLILCNPPFHSGAALRDDLAERMLAPARRVLRPGGEVWTVFNSPLPYPPMLRRVVGPTDVVARNAKFTVTRSRRED